jgi:hypothetical protein
MNTNVAWLFVAAETDAAKQYATISSDNYHEMQFSTRDKAKSYQPSDAVRRVEIVFNGADAGKPMPQTLLSLQAVYEDGSVVASCPAPRYVAPKKQKNQIPELPSVPPVVNLADGTWRVTPPMQIKYSTNGQYYSVAYAFIHKGSPVSGYFDAPTEKDLFDVIFSTQNDAISDGRGGWLDAHNPRVPGTPTTEQTYRAQLPIADSGTVQKWLDRVAAYEAAKAAEQAELYREPTEVEIAAVDVSPETLARMSAAVQKARYLGDKAFRVALDRREAFEKAIKEKERKEAAEVIDRKAVDHGRKVLALREQGIVSER